MEQFAYVNDTEYSAEVNTPYGTFELDPGKTITEKNLIKDYLLPSILEESEKALIMSSGENRPAMIMDPMVVNRICLVLKELLERN